MTKFVDLKSVSEKKEKYALVNALGFPMCLAFVSDINNGFLKVSSDQRYPWLKRGGAMSAYSFSSSLTDELKQLNNNSGSYLAINNSTEEYFPLFLNSNDGINEGHFVLSFNTEAERDFHLEIFDNIFLPKLRKVWHKQSTSRKLNAFIDRNHYAAQSGLFLPDTMQSVAHGMYSIYALATQITSGYERSKDKIDLNKYKINLIRVLRSGFLSKYTAGLDLDVLAQSNLAGLCPHHSEGELDDLSYKDVTVRKLFNNEFKGHFNMFSPCPFVIPLDEEIIEHIKVLYRGCKGSKALLKRLPNYIGLSGIDIFCNLLADLIEAES